MGRLAGAGAKLGEMIGEVRVTGDMCSATLATLDYFESRALKLLKAGVMPGGIVGDMEGTNPQPLLVLKAPCFGNSGVPILVYSNIRTVISTNIF